MTEIPIWAQAARESWQWRERYRPSFAVPPGWSQMSVWAFPRPVDKFDASSPQRLHCHLSLRPPGLGAGQSGPICGHFRIADAMKLPKYSGAPIGSGKLARGSKRNFWSAEIVESPTPQDFAGRTLVARKPADAGTPVVRMIEHCPRAVAASVTTKGRVSESRVQPWGCVCGGKILATVMTTFARARRHSIVGSPRAGVP